MLTLRSVGIPALPRSVAVFQTAVKRLDREEVNFSNGKWDQGVSLEVFVSHQPSADHPRKHAIVVKLGRLEAQIESLDRLPDILEEMTIAAGPDLRLATLQFFKANMRGFAVPPTWSKRPRYESTPAAVVENRSDPVREGESVWVRFCSTGETEKLGPHHRTRFSKW